LNTELKQKVQRWKLAIQEFDFDIEHIPGPKNIVADGFSRFCNFPNNTDYDFATLNALFTEILQSQKTEISEINHYNTDDIELNDEEKYDMIDNKHELHIPEVIHKIIKQVHNSAVGHFGVELTLKKLNNLIEDNENYHKYKNLKYKRRYVNSFIR
jgi:hypothetical protein